MLTVIFAKILSMSLVGGYIILVALAVRFLLHNCERKCSFFLWFVVFLNLCLPVSISGPFSLVPKALVVNVQTVTQRSAEIVLFSGQSILSILWIFIAAVVLGICAVKVIRINRRFRKGNDGGEAIGDGIVYLKDSVSPFIWGVSEPVIYIPADMEEEERDYILAHESFHRKRSIWGNIVATCLVIFMACGLTWRPQTEKSVNTEVEALRKIHEAEEEAWNAKLESLRSADDESEEGFSY